MQRGAASAMKTQKRSMATPNAALLDRKMPDIIGGTALRLRATSLSTDGAFPADREALMFEKSPRAKVLSYCASSYLLSHSRSLKPKARIQEETAYVRHHLGCHRHKGHYQRCSLEQCDIVPHGCIEHQTP